MTWDVLERGEILASNYTVLGQLSTGIAPRAGLTRDRRAVLPAPAGPRRRKLLRGGDATAR